ncbi:helix-turn-helix domain-containing protein [Streptomyces sp. NPDC021093]|uniref:helix-turn-helix domain-containing protein n=1 Tax=Streptomyces sp. NPDC021093 TaxID=3365112 RepID=UPI0037B87604
MALRTNITERQRRLGAELRKLREHAALTVNEASRSIGMGAAHLSHIEAARTAIPTDRLTALLRTYGVSSEPYIAALVGMAESNGRGWWSDYRKSMGKSALDLAELESRATRIRSHETLLVPGLLQTEAYMRALFRSARPGATPEEIEASVRFRLDRQRVLADSSETSFHAIVHEAALRIAVGGSHVMRGQLTRLIEAAERPGTTIQILPFEAGSRAWFGTPFLILRPGVEELETVILEHPAEPLRLGDNESIARYDSTFDGLAKSALPEVTPDRAPSRHEARDSWGLIQHVLYTH